MPSLVPGYQYDIFISYRQKDNKGDHWVTEFVNALRTELDGTFKEDVTIYFDENPHDGLVEIHDVDRSLKEKIKCLIFIPVLSRTYCDPRSFAWQHELLPFRDFATGDSSGLKVTVSHGNVVSRILPVRIYELSPEDIALFETETKGPVRAIDFVFKSQGINRPLLAGDRKEENASRTLYRDQVNKLANVISEMIAAMRSPASSNSQSNAQQEPAVGIPTSHPRTKRLLIVAAAMLVLFASAWFANAYYFADRPPVVIDKSIAVLPFADISDAHDQAYFSDGMMVEILDHLYKIKDLRIVPRTTMQRYRDTTMPLREIAGELGVAHVIQGSVRKAGNRVKISVQLVDGKTERNLWQQTYDRDLADVFSVQSDVASQIAHELQASISPEVKKRMDQIPTRNQEAYDLYLKGKQVYQKVWLNLNTDNVKEGIGYLKSAVTLDSTFSNAFAGLGECYWMLAHYARDYDPAFWNLSKKYLKRAIALNPNNGWAYAELAVVQHNWDWDKEGARRSLRQAVKLNPSDNEVYVDLWYFYQRTMECDSMNVIHERMIEIDQSFQSDLQTVWALVCRGQTEALRRMSPPKEVGASGFAAEMERLLIIQEYQNAMEFLERHPIKEQPTLYYFYKAEILAMQGKRKEAETIVRELKILSKTVHVWPAMFAVLYAALGDDEKAYEYIEQSIREHSLMMHDLPYYAAFYYKRNDPRFKAAMKRTWIN